MAGFNAPGVPVVGPGSTYPALTGYEQTSVDTELVQGKQPQVVAPTIFQIASFANSLDANVATAVAGAATLNTTLGAVISNSITTAAGATYSLTLTNSTITAASKMQVAVYNGSNTGGAPIVQSVTPGAGSAVIVILNNGTTAFNGTLQIPFQTR